MSDFSAPPGKRPPVKVPAVVPIADAPPEKQQEYKELVKVLAGEDIDKKLEEDAQPVDGPSEVTSQIQIGDTILTLSVDGRVLAADKLEASELDPSEPSEEDKQAFVRSLLGDKSFEKEFVVFGEIKIKFRDRSVEDTEKMYKRIDSTEPKPASPEEWAITLEREITALTLVTINGSELPVEKMETLTAMQRPLYHAVLECSRTFERTVEILVSRALDQGFWKAGGAA